MRAITPIATLVLLLSLAAPGAFAQSEEEQIMQSGQAPEQSAQQAPPEEPKKQHREDDDIDEEELDEQVFYSGLGVERVSTDFDNLGEATNIAAVLGFRIPTLKWIGLEIDLGQTLIPGENDNTSSGGTSCSPLDPLCTPTPGTTADSDEFAMQALGLSLALKSTGRFYVMGRYGYRYLATSIDELNEDRSHSGFGAGVGYRWGRGLSGVELSYKELAKDVESVGLTFFVRPSRR